MYVQEQNMNELFPGGAGPDASLIDWTTTTSPFGQTDETEEDVGTTARSVYWTIHYIAGVVGGIGGAYHGYKRNKSAGWAIGWFFFGSIIPELAIPIALAQGFAKPKGS